MQYHFLVSKDEKLLKRFLGKHNVSIDDCHKILIAHGYYLNKSGGSHMTYHKKDAVPVVIVIPKHTKYVLSLYIERIIKDLGLEGIK